MTVDPVRDQYEAYPYPARDPADEAGRLVELNHNVFGGRRDFARPFRALVAGGGTGDAAIMLARQLADEGGAGEVVYLDLSRASRKIAEARAAARGLANIRFVNGAIEDVAARAPGPFEYIDCCGVLHHLEDPAAGLRALAGVLADDGGMGLMLYGELGRAGVYDMQEMMRALAPQDPAPERIGLARRLLKQLPETNRLRRNPFVGDHLDGGDAGLFDLFLHARDRAYRVPEIVALAAAAAMRVTAFIEPARYDPARLLNDPALAKRLAALPWLERCAFAELLAGNMRKHVFYLVKRGNTSVCVADPEDGAAIPVLHEMDAAETAKAWKPGAVVTTTLDGLTLRFPLPPLAGAMVARMDGRRTVDAIFADLAGTNPGLERARFNAQFRQLFDAMNGVGKLFLRHD